MKSFLSRFQNGCGGLHITRKKRRCIMSSVAVEEVSKGRTNNSELEPESLWGGALVE